MTAERLRVLADGVGAPTHCSGGTVCADTKPANVTAKKARTFVFMMKSPLRVCGCGNRIHHGPTVRGHRPRGCALAHRFCKEAVVAEFVPCRLIAPAWACS